MIVGACGICCDVCRLYISGACSGCAPGNDCPVEKVVSSGCPILSCATSRNIPYCPRDCAEFPCALFRHGLPLCKRSVQVEVEAQPEQILSDWTSVGLQIAVEEKSRAFNGRGPQLYVFCLGQFRVYRGQTYITEEEWAKTRGATQKIKALFAFLLTNGACGATKDEIIEFLWGDEALGEKAEVRLHSTLYYLRRVLEPDLQPRAESKYVVFRDGRYFLSPPNGYWVDATAFETHYQHALRLEAEGQVETAVKYWELADALYQGDYMIDLMPYYNESYDDCCRWRHYRLKDNYLTVLLKLARAHFCTHQYRWSLSYAQKALAEDWCCEEAHRLIMRLKHQAGLRGELIRQYRLCQRSLADAENRPLSPETTGLFEQLLANIPTQSA